jgi:hypothetical protein
VLEKVATPLPLTLAVPVRVAGTKNAEVTLTPAIDQYRTVPLDTLVVVTVVVMTSF